MQKKAFPKKYVDINIKDLGFLEYADDDIVFRFWGDPSQEVVFTLMTTTLFTSSKEVAKLTQEQSESLNEKFMRAACEIIIDSNVEGLDFSTPESTELAFYHESLPWAFLFEVLQQYVIKLMAESNKLKKTLDRLAKIASSGKDNETKEQT